LKHEFLNPLIAYRDLKYELSRLTSELVVIENQLLELDQSPLIESSSVQSFSDLVTENLPTPAPTESQVFDAFLSLQELFDSYGLDVMTVVSKIPTPDSSESVEPLFKALYVLDRRLNSLENQDANMKEIVLAQESGNLGNLVAQLISNYRLATSLAWKQFNLNLPPGTPLQSINIDRVSTLTLGGRIRALRASRAHAVKRITELPEEIAKAQTEFKSAFQKYLQVENMKILTTPDKFLYALRMHSTMSLDEFIRAAGSVGTYFDGSLKMLDAEAESVWPSEQQSGSGNQELRVFKEEFDAAKKNGVLDPQISKFSLENFLEIVEAHMDSSWNYFLIEPSGRRTVIDLILRRADWLPELVNIYQGRGPSNANKSLSGNDVKNKLKKVVLPMIGYDLEAYSEALIKQKPHFDRIGIPSSVFTKWLTECDEQMLRLMRPTTWF
jgi:hypothetical protein